MENSSRMYDSHVRGLNRVRSYYGVLFRWKDDLISASPNINERILIPQGTHANDLRARGISSWPVSKNAHLQSEIRLLCVSLSFRSPKIAFAKDKHSSLDLHPDSVASCSPSCDPRFDRTWQPVHCIPSQPGSSFPLSTNIPLGLG